MILYEEECKGLGGLRRYLHEARALSRDLFTCTSLRLPKYHEERATTKDKMPPTAQKTSNKRR